MITLFEPCTLKGKMISIILETYNFACLNSLIDCIFLARQNKSDTSFIYKEQTTEFFCLLVEVSFFIYHSWQYFPSTKFYHKLKKLYSRYTWEVLACDQSRKEMTFLLSSERKGSFKQYPCGFLVPFDVLILRVMNA